MLNDQCSVLSNCFQELFHGRVVKIQGHPRKQYRGFHTLCDVSCKLHSVECQLLSVTTSAYPHSSCSYHRLPTNHKEQVLWNPHQTQDVLSQIRNRRTGIQLRSEHIGSSQSRSLNPNQRPRINQFQTTWTGLIADVHQNSGDNLCPLDDVRARRSRRGL